MNLEFVKNVNLFKPFKHFFTIRWCLSLCKDKWLWSTLIIFLMFDLLQTNGQTRKSIYLLQVDLICPGSSLRHKTLIEKRKRPQQRRPFMICWTLWGTWPLGLSWKDYKVTLKAILPTIWRWKCINWCKIWCTSETSTVLLERPWLSKIFSKLFWYYSVETQK